VNPPYGPKDIDLAAGRFDFDVYRRFDFNRSSILAGGTVTGAQIENNYAGHAEESAGGVGFVVEGRHRFYDSPVVAWSVFSRGRWSALVGEWSSFNSKGNSNLNIFEAALGLEYRRRFQAADLVVQYSFEGQSWDTTYVGDVTFMGSTLSIGFAH